MSDLRHDWTLDEVVNLFGLPFNDLIFKSHSLYRTFSNPNEVQLSTLLNIKTGGCPENCCYCSQSSHYKTGLQKETLLNLEVVEQAVVKAKHSGANRFCFAAAWRQVNDRDIEHICSIVNIIKNYGMESCASLGMITAAQAQRLKAAGLDFYNHNIDTSRGFYNNVVTTRTYDDRLQTVQNIQYAGIKVCCGGIIGMGESVQDRAEMLITLAKFNPHPTSVPINKLVPIAGTPFGKKAQIDNLSFVRTIAVARILMPKSYVRLAAGRDGMSDEMQALCLFAGANSIFYGEKLLTTPNPDTNSDADFIKKLGVEVAATV